MGLKYSSLKMKKIANVSVHLGVGGLALLDAILIYLICFLKGVNRQCLDIHNAHHASLWVFPQVKFGFALVRLI